MRHHSRAAIATPMAALAVSASIFLGGFAAAAHADVTEIQKTLQTVQGRTLTGTRTTYVSGRNVRIDSDQGSVIIDGRRHTMTLVNTAQKAYLESSYRPQQGNPTAVAISVKKTGKRSIMLGHPVTLYNVQITPSGATAQMAAKGTIWAADDFPHPDLSNLGLPALNGFGASNKIPGLPMETKMTDPNGAVLTTTVVSLTTMSIPSSRFKVPDGFRNMTAAVAAAHAAQQPRKPGH